MADINYETTVDWDLDVRDVGFCDADNSTLAGLAESGIYMVTGTPANTPDHWIPGATIKNSVDGTEYINQGTTASPNFVVNGTTSGGITQLTGDVTAGPGTGSQVATIGAGKVVASMIAVNAVDGTKISLASEVAGDIMYFNGTDWIRLAKGTAGQVLTMNAGATAPEWQ